jgi:hypothetical protein
MTGLLWQLQYSASGSSPGANMQFGTEDSGLLMTAMPVIDSADFTLGDQQIPQSDGLIMGQDFKGGRNITLALETVLSSEDDARDLVEDFAAAWDAEAVRNSPGALAALVAHTGRIAFGRPRKFPPDDTRSFHGRIAVAPEFLTADDVWYDAMQSESVGLIPVETGGLMSPLTTPLMMAAATTYPSSFTVGGRKATWPWLRIRGPIANPVVSVTGQFTFAFPVTLGPTDTITIDTRPWVRRVALNGAYIAPTAASSRMATAALPPGTYALVLSGTAPTGAPAATITWRNAYRHW